MGKHFQHKRYEVKAKRKNEDIWTEWTRVDDFAKAQLHAKKAEDAGYDSTIVDKGVLTDEQRTD